MILIPNVLTASTSLISVFLEEFRMVEPTNQISEMSSPAFQFSIENEIEILESKNHTDVGTWIILANLAHLMNLQLNGNKL